MKASVIISAYNNLEDLRLLLPSLEQQVLDRHEMEVILRDDGSGDGTGDWVRQHHPWVQLIQGENAGFSKSNNIAADRATGEALVFINADTILDKRFITAGLNVFDHEPLLGGLNCNMIMPWVMDVSAFLEGQRPAAGHGHFLNRYGFAEYREVKTERCRTAFLSGGGCFVRRMALGEESPFAEDLWGGTSYCEDLDLSLRLLAKGWRLCFEPAAILYHNQRPVQEAGFNQLKKFLRISANRVTVYAINLSLSCFLRVFPRLFYGVFHKVVLLPLPEKIRKKILAGALIMMPLFLMLLPYWIYRGIGWASGRNSIQTLSFLKEGTYGCDI